MIVREWVHEGYSCAILKHNELGHLCGYVAVTESHPFYGKNYNQCLEGCAPVPYEAGEYFTQEMADRMNERSGGHYDCIYEKEHLSIDRILDVHGGITYSGSTLADIENGMWWLGFDCGHVGDYSPGIAATLLKTGYTDHLLRNDETYRDEDYVTAEILKLVTQIAKEAK